VNKKSKKLLLFVTFLMINLFLRLSLEPGPLEPHPVRLRLHQNDAVPAVQLTLISNNVFFNRWVEHKGRVGAVGAAPRHVAALAQQIL
jgi:hypothetical protein